MPLGCTQTPLSRPLAAVQCHRRCLPGAGLHPGHRLAVFPSASPRPKEPHQASCPGAGGHFTDSGQECVASPVSF